MLFYNSVSNKSHISGYKGQKYCSQLSLGSRVCAVTGLGAEQRLHCPLPRAPAGHELDPVRVTPECAKWCPDVSPQQGPRAPPPSAVMPWGDSTLAVTQTSLLTVNYAGLL